MSSIELKINKNKIDLQIPEFICDGNLNPNLIKYEMLNHMNNYCFTSVVGRPGSGKTSWVVGLLTGKKKEKNHVFRKVFNNILLVMPSVSRESMKKNIFKNHDEDKMYDELDYENINDIHNKLVESTKNNESTLLIMDDIGASLKNNEIQKKLREIIYNRRHLKVQIIILIQSLLSTPLE